MTGTEALEKLEATVRTVIGNKREDMHRHKENYKNMPSDDPYYLHNLYKYRETFREVQTLKNVLIWIDDIKEECEEEP